MASTCRIRHNKSDSGKESEGALRNKCKRIRNSKMWVGKVVEVRRMRLRVLEKHAEFRRAFNRKSVGQELVFYSSNLRETPQVALNERCRDAIIYDSYGI